MTEPQMPRDRWSALMKGDNLQLTQDEIMAGWHFCWEWDGLLVGPGMDELKACTCVGEGHSRLTLPTPATN
jgi:hypothetical protein